MNKHLPVVIVALALLLLIFPGIVRAETLTIGTISNDPVTEIRRFKPFADFLAKRLASDGIDKVNVVVAADIPDIAEKLRRQEVDLFIDSSVTALAVNKLSGSKFMLRRWKKGRDKYRSVIFVLEDSDITDLDDLKGKVIAFEEPFSTSGFILPALALRQRGMGVDALKGFRARPLPDRVGYVMGYDNETQATWLERGRVQAAAMAESDFEDYRKTSLKPFRRLFTTPFVPYHVVVNRRYLDPKLLERLKLVLKTADETEQGRIVLQKFERTTKFDDIPEDLLAEVMKLEPYLNIIVSFE